MLILRVTNLFQILQACDMEEDGLFGFDLHSDGDGNRFFNFRRKIV